MTAVAASAALSEVALDATARVEVSNAPREPLTIPEQQELAAAVLVRLRRILAAEESDVEELAALVAEMVEQEQGRHEMACQLADLLEDEAEPFLDWLDEERRRVLERRSSVQGPPRRRAQLTTNDVTASLEQSQGAAAGASATEADGSQEDSVGFEGVQNSAHSSQWLGSLVAHESSDNRSYVVVTQKLVLQPNASQVVNPEDGVQGSKDTARAFAWTKRMELLADMTKKLQEILKRLSDKSLSDEAREKYQALAQSIQARMRQLGDPA